MRTGCAGRAGSGPRASLPAPGVWHVTGDGVSAMVAGADPTRRSHRGPAIGAIQSRWRSGQDARGPGTHHRRLARHPRRRSGQDARAPSTHARRLARRRGGAGRLGPRASRPLRGRGTSRTMACPRRWQEATPPDTPTVGRQSARSKRRRSGQDARAPSTHARRLARRRGGGAGRMPAHPVGTPDGRGDAALSGWGLVRGHPCPQGAGEAGVRVADPWRPAR